MPKNGDRHTTIPKLKRFVYNSEQNLSLTDDVNDRAVRKTRIPSQASSSDWLEADREHYIPR